MDRFLTQKLSWNRFTAPPHHSFHWHGIDGSKVLTHFPPSDTYNGLCTMEELRYHAANYKDADRSREALYLFGYGDGGGGPDADMIESLRRSGNLLGVPKSTTRDPNDFFDRLEREAGDFATVEGELYFEYHRGTYTSQAEVKRLNRLIEGRLQTLDLLCAASLLAGKPAPSRAEIEALWRVLLVNQFHDILPGSSIGEVYVRTRKELTELADQIETLSQKLLDGLSSGGAAMPFNPTGFARDEIIIAPDGRLTYVHAEPFSAGQIEDPQDEVHVTELENGDIRLQNWQLNVVLTRTGYVRSIIGPREALDAIGNRFVLFDDRPTEYEAWDVDPFALETGREGPPAERCEIVSRGPLRAEVRFEHRVGKSSRLTQTIRLDAESNCLEFDTEIDWRERRKLLKVIFPLACTSPRATYETMFGAVERPTHANNRCRSGAIRSARPSLGRSVGAGFRRLAADGFALRLRDLRQRHEPQPAARYGIAGPHRGYRRPPSALCALSA